MPFFEKHNIGFLFFILERLGLSLGRCGYHEDFQEGESLDIYIYIFWEEIHTILRGVHDILRFLGRSSHNMGRCRLRLERVHDIYGFLGKKIIHFKIKKIQIGTTTTCIQSLGGGDRQLWIAQEEDQEEIMTLLEEEAWSPLDLEIGG